MISRDSVNTKEEAYKLFEWSLLNFRKSISLSISNAYDLFTEYVKNNPRLGIYLKEISYKTYTKLFKTYTEIILDYNNVDVPFDLVLLCNNYKDAYTTIWNNIENSEDKFIICTNKSLDLIKVIEDFKTDNMGFFYKLRYIEYQSFNFDFFGLSYMIVNITYNMKKDRLRLLEYEIDREVNRLSKILFCDDMPKETKAYIAHNYLASTITYTDVENEISLSKKSFVQSAYGALLNHKCVCQGYAEAFKRLMDTQNISCLVLTGKVKNDEEYHAWNVVSFDNVNYFHIDCTWDSPGSGKALTDYFCLTDEVLTRSRLWTRRPHVVCKSKVNILDKVINDLRINKTKYKSKGIDVRYL